MSLFDTYQNKIPLTWSVTSDPDVILDTLKSICADNTLFFMHEGLLCCMVDGKPLKVLETEKDEETGEEYQVPVSDSLYAVKVVQKRQGVFFLPNAASMFDGMMKAIAISIVSDAASAWRRSVLEDNLELHPGSLIVTSHDAEIPPEIANYFSVLDEQYPPYESLANTIALMHSRNSSILRDVQDISPIAKAAVGMTEFDFLRQSIHSIAKDKHIVPENIRNNKIKSIKDRGILDFKTPSLTFDDIGGLDNIKEIIASARWMYENPEEVQRLDIQPIRRILMVGVPGTGKSAICEATAAALGFDLAKFGVSKMMSKWVGESESNMRAAFDQMKAISSVGGIVAWIDEFGRDATEGMSSDSGTTMRVHAELLTGLQELPDNVFLMAAANNIAHLAPELLRADRFDSIVFVGFPTVEERVSILNIHLGQRANDLNIDTIAQATMMFTGAEIKGLVKDTTSRICVRERRDITTDDLVALAGSTKNRLWLRHRDMIVEMYKMALSEWDWASSAQLAEAETVISGQISRSPQEKATAAAKSSYTF